MTKAQWQAIKNHDPDFNGKFFYSLKGSKTFCCPSCTFRKCHPNNVLIFETVEAAISDGFLPCCHCRPDIPDWKGARHHASSRAKEYIDEHYSEKFSLEEIADALYINKIYLSKCFKDTTGDTLLHYHNKVRCRHACELLSDPSLSIDAISHNVGYATSSHFARIFRSIYNCSPTQYRNNYLDSLE